MSFNFLKVAFYLGNVPLVITLLAACMVKTKLLAIRISCI